MGANVYNLELIVVECDFFYQPHKDHSFFTVMIMVENKHYTLISAVLSGNSTLRRIFPMQPEIQ